MSSGSESDEDFLPGEPEQLSEEDSADEETDLQFEKEIEQKTYKRKSSNACSNEKKKRKSNHKVSSEHEDSQTDVSKVENREEEKKREEDLWAKFLEGTDTNLKPKVNNNSVTTAKCTDLSDPKATTSLKTKKAEDFEAKERRIFEFAGETIVVEDNVIKEKIKTADNPALATKLQGPSHPRSGGLSNVLGQLNKKNKLSTLEKSKLDWETLKKEEGLEEEIKSHNKGKEGYLDRQDFLERADLRQYEIERDLRLSRRSKR